MLAEGKSLGTNKLGSLLLLDLAHAHLACIGMLLSVHLNVVLWVTTLAVLLIETTVAAVQNIGFRVGKVGIAFRIDGAILVSNMLGHEWSPMC